MITLKKKGALTNVASLAEHRPVHGRVSGLILVRAHTQFVGHMQEATHLFLSHIHVFLSLILSIPLSPKSIIKKQKSKTDSGGK